MTQHEGRVPMAYWVWTDADEVEWLRGREREARSMALACALVVAAAVLAAWPGGGEPAVCATVAAMFGLFAGAYFFTWRRLRTRRHRLTLRGAGRGGVEKAR